MSPTDFGWLILFFPLAGSIVLALGWRFWPGRLAGWIGTAAIAAAFVCSIGAFVAMLDRPTDDRQVTSTLYDYASSIGLGIDVNILVDPLAVVMCLVVTGVSTLIHLYSVAYMGSDRGYTRFFSYLNFFVFSMLLLVLAANFVLLIVGWAFVGFASYALISFWYRRGTATKAGMKAFVINVIGDVGLVLAAFLIFRELGTFDYLDVFETAGGHFAPNDGTIVAICLLLLVGAVAKSAQLPLHTWLPDAMEGPTPGLRPDPRRDDGHRRRLPDRPHVAPVRPGADRGGHLGVHRPRNAARGGDDRARRHRPEADHRLLDHEPDRLHGRRGLDRRLHRRDLPPDDPRLLQGAPLHGRRLGHRRDGQQPGHRPDVRLPARVAVHVTAPDHRRARPGRVPGDVGLLLEGRDPRVRRRPGRHVLDLHDRGLPRRVPDRLLRVPDRLQSGHGRSLRGGPRARAGPPRPRRTGEPRDRREGGHRGRLPGRRAPHRRARAAHADRDGRSSGSSRSSQASSRSRASRTRWATSSRGRSRTRRCSTSIPPPRRRTSGCSSAA